MSCVLPPAVSDVGVAPSVSEGAGVVDVTVTVTERLALVPSVLEQVSVNVEVALKGPTVWLPLVALPPVQLPDAVQALALVADQVSVLVPCAGTDVALALSDTVGAGVVVPPPLACL